MADRGTVGFTRVLRPAHDHVDPSLRYQPMDGFGASITDSSASLLSDSTRRPATRRCATSSTPRRPDFLRQPVGSSDFVDGPHYTYDDVAAGRDRLRPVTVLHRARPGADPAAAAPGDAAQPRLVMATPWSPPAWMKTGDSLVGGRLKDDPGVYDAYARYLVKFVQAYAGGGRTGRLLSVQNEPQNRKPSGYPGTDCRSASRPR